MDPREREMVTAAAYGLKTAREELGLHVRVTAVDRERLKRVADVLDELVFGRDAKGVTWEPSGEKRVPLSSVATQLNSDVLARIMAAAVEASTSAGGDVALDLLARGIRQFLTKDLLDPDVLLHPDKYR